MLCSQPTKRLATDVEFSLSSHQDTLTETLVCVSHELEGSGDDSEYTGRLSGIFQKQTESNETQQGVKGGSPDQS